MSSRAGSLFATTQRFLARFKIASRVGAAIARGVIVARADVELGPTASDHEVIGVVKGIRQGRESG